jgi:hypothetical protein
VAPPSTSVEKLLFGEKKEGHKFLCKYISRSVQGKLSSLESESFENLFDLHVEDLLDSPVLLCRLPVNKPEMKAPTRRQSLPMNSIDKEDFFSTAPFFLDLGLEVSSYIGQQVKILKVKNESRL